MAKFIISCGGTGGHLAPGISLAEGLEERGHSCKLVISRKEVDSRLIRKYPNLDTAKFPGTGFSLRPDKALRFALTQIKAIAKAFAMLRAEKPDAIVGFGGFLTVAVVISGFFLRIPITLHEANRKPGRAIRLLSSLADRVYLPPGVRFKGYKRGVRNAGFPLRREIRRIPRDKARRELGLPMQGKVLLVVGGSQGAASLNRWVTEEFDKLGRDGINVVCITGMGKGGRGTIEVRSEQGAVARAIFIDFCDDMRVPLSAADVVVARAGAGSLAEFMRCGLPSVLVPFPHAADNHQLENARYLEQIGAAVLVEQKQMDTLTDEVIELLNNEWLLGRFHKNLKRFEKEDDLARIVNDLEALIAARNEEAVSVSHA